MPVAPPADSYSFQSALRNPRTRRLFFCLLLALVTMGFYNSVTRAPFLNFDDSVYVTDNLQVRAGLSWKTVVWAFRTPKALDWHPVTWLSYALDCQMFGLNPAGYHTVNILLHTANALLLFLILESATGLAWRSLAVAALFALHPINVESVAWISERKSVLSMFFFLLALAVYGWYARRPGVGRYLAVTLAYVLGLMSKAQVITFPFALLLLDYWPLDRFALPKGDGALASHVSESASPVDKLRAGCGTPRFWKLVWEKVPWIALSAGSAVITMKTGGQAFSYMLEPDAALAKFPLWVRLANAAISYGKYLEKTFWPVNLAVVYPHPGLAISISAAVLSALALLALTVVALIFRQRRPFFVGWFWFLGTLVPMSGLVQIGVHSMADRYAYIPLLGIFVVVCWGAAEAIQAWKIPAAVAAACGAIILLGLGFTLHRQVGFWSDNVTLWTHTRQITAVNFTTEDNVATALISEGRVEEAVPYLQRAQRLRPDDPLSMINLATYQQMHGNYQAALDGYARVVQFTRTPYLLANARINSGYAHLSLHQYEGAKQDFEAARRVLPENFAAYRGLGLAAQRSGDIGEAIRQYQRAVELEPSAVGYLLLSQALEIGGESEAARSAREHAGRMTRDPNDDLATVKQLLAN